MKNNSKLNVIELEALLLCFSDFIYLCKKSLEDYLYLLWPLVVCVLPYGSCDLFY